MFTHSCYIKKNTKKIRNQLKKLGYKENPYKSVSNDEQWIYCNSPYFSVESPLVIKSIEGYEETINCEDNENLFFSIAALREDTDKYQWFTDGNLWEMTNGDLPSKYMQLEGHKASIKELLNKFKI